MHKAALRGLRGEPAGDRGGRRAVPGRGGERLPFAGEREVASGVSHTFSGNPDRFRSGRALLRPDEGWKRGMGAPRQALVAALTLPGMARYGYPLRPQRQGSARRG